MALLLTFALTFISEISAGPIYRDIDRFIESPVGSIDRFDDDYYLNYRQDTQRQPNVLPIDRLKRGYYFVDNGSIRPVTKPESVQAPSTQAQAATRRQDNFSNTVDINSLPGGVKFTPLVRFKQTETRRKRLFVPNLFG